MAAGETNRGAKVVTVTALVVAAILAYYYWTETTISGDLFVRLERASVDLGVANRTVRDQTVTLDAQKQQLTKLEEEKKKLEEEKTELEKKKKEAEDSTKKLTEEKARCPESSIVIKTIVNTIRLGSRAPLSLSP